jgi:NAD(P)-dependent dehydrogenase (short-subunit alcohol dehydrogenase family)
MWLSRGIDAALDRTIAPGFSAVGFAVRRHLPGWPPDPEPRCLRGKTAIVTGASSGLGVATAEELARLGAAVHLVVRNIDKGKATLVELRGRVPGAVFTLGRCDVSDLDDVAAFCAELAGHTPSVDIIVHNAGAMPSAKAWSAQGHEMTMALHVLGPLAMTERLLPVLAPGARVIFVTSGGMYAQRLRADDPDFNDGDYSGVTAYARSKRAQVELLPTLRQRWASYDVLPYAMHPGWVDTPGVAESLPTFRRLTKPILRGDRAGVDTTVWLAAIEPAPPAGGLWHDRRERATNVRPGTRASGAEVAQLWEWVARNADLNC